MTIGTEIEGVPHARNSTAVRLREVDWRFLLPALPAGGVKRLVLLGGDAATADLLRQIGVAEQVALSLSEQGSADALVLLRGAAIDIAVAARCLRQGGVLYVEVDRRDQRQRWLTPARVVRMLQRASLTVCGTYWARPSFDRCQMVIPLDRPRALDWHLSSIFSATTPLWRVAEPGLRAAARYGGALLPYVASCFVVTAIRDRVVTPPSLLAHEGLPYDLRQRGLQPLLLLAGDDDFNRVIALPFAAGERLPRAVFKLSRQHWRNLHTENEQRVLAQLRAELGPPLRDSLPEPLGVVPWHGISVGIERCMPGRLLVTTTARWGAPLTQKIAQLRLAAAWLTTFHQAIQTERRAWSEADLEQNVLVLFRAYQEAFGLSPGEQQLFAAAERRGRNLIGLPLPRVWEHYAYEDRNIYGSKTISVIDWEGGSLNLPLFDLLYYGLQWYYRVLYLRWSKGQAGAFSELYCRDTAGNRAAQAVDACIGEYLAALAIDARFRPLLLVLMWTARALSRYDRHTELALLGTNPRLGNQYVEYVEALAAHSGLLFANDIHDQ